MDDNKKNAVVRKESGALMKWPQSIDTIVEPVADVFETADAFIIKLDLPGADKESINLSIEQDRLTVKASIELKYKEESKLLYSEIIRKSYLRRFILKHGIDLEHIGAEFKNGVLTITLPKTDEAKAKEIKIN